MGFSRQEYWSGSPLPAPGGGVGVHKWKNVKGIQQTREAKTVTAKLCKMYVRERQAAHHCGSVNWEVGITPQNSEEPDQERMNWVMPSSIFFVILVLLPHCGYLIQTTLNHHLYCTKQQKFRSQIWALIFWAFPKANWPSLLCFRTNSPCPSPTNSQSAWLLSCPGPKP